MITLRRFFKFIFAGIRLRRLAYKIVRRHFDQITDYNYDDAEMTPYSYYVTFTKVRSYDNLSDSFKTHFIYYTINCSYDWFSIRREEFSKDLKGRFYKSFPYWVKDFKKFDNEPGILKALRLSNIKYEIELDTRNSYNEVQARRYAIYHKEEMNT